MIITMYILAAVWVVGWLLVTCVEIERRDSVGRGPATTAPQALAGQIDVLMIDNSIGRAKSWVLRDRAWSVGEQ